MKVSLSGVGMYGWLLGMHAFVIVFPFLLSALSL